LWPSAPRFSASTDRDMLSYVRSVLEELLAIIVRSGDLVKHAPALGAKLQGFARF
jgi:hypothetical protein